MDHPLDPSLGPALQDVLSWRKGIVARYSFQCTPIDFSESKEWRFEDGHLRHRTGGFFSLAGLEAQARHPGLDGREQLIILQPLIGIVGFLVRRGKTGPEILFQGRVEPGNVGAVQLAPTVQSTQTNYKRLHGGGPTPLVEWFLSNDGTRTLFDEPQSEEASRYYGKYNRNIVLDVPAGMEVDLPFNFRWYGTDALRVFATADNVLNTDARSVLSCMPWEALADDGAPFAGGSSGTLASRLRASYMAAKHGTRHSIEEILHWLMRLRVHAGLRGRVIPIHQLKNWIIEKGTIRERERELGFCARQFRVVAHGREVDEWDQPLIDSDGVGRVILITQVRDGILHLLLRASHEIGYLEGVQLSASICVAPGETFRPDEPLQEALMNMIDGGDKTTTHLTCRQSEEGGRFYQDENDYAVIEVDEGVNLPDSPYCRWVTLGQIKRLVSTPGVLAMELRGALALLLAYV